MLKAKFSIGDKVEFVTMPISMCITQIVRTPKLKYSPAHIAYVCCNEYGDSKLIDEQDLVKVEKVKV